MKKRYKIFQLINDGSTGYVEKGLVLRGFDNDFETMGDAEKELDVLPTESKSWSLTILPIYKN